jgi:hypothetical protein
VPPNGCELSCSAGPGSGSSLYDTPSGKGRHQVNPATPNGALSGNLDAG